MKCILLGPQDQYHVMNTNLNPKLPPSSHFFLKKSGICILVVCKPTPNVLIMHPIFLAYSIPLNLNN